MQEILFDKFIDDAALAEQEKLVMEIFSKIKAELLDLSKVGVKIDISPGLRDLTKQIDELKKKEEELTQKMKQVEEVQARMAAQSKEMAAETARQAKSVRDLSSDYETNIKRQIELKQRLDQIKQSLKSLNEFKNAAKDSEEFNNEIVRLTGEQAELKIALQATNKLINNQTREFLAAGGSIDEARAKVNVLTQVYDSLNEAQRNAEGGQNLKKQIADLDAELKKLEGETGRFQRNVGNYANSLAGGFEKVRAEIARLKQEQQGLQDLTKRSPIGFQFGDQERLNQVTAAIAELETVSQIGFQTTGNYTKQVKQLEQAYINLATSGTQSTEFLEAFKNEIGKAKDAANDLRESINLAASDTRTLDVLIGAGQAIAGGFGVAQGAVAVFGDNSEDLQRTLVKLNGVMTILNGLQAIQNELKKKDNIVTLSQIALQKTYAFVVGTSTGALKAFRIALAATGVGLVIIGLVTLAQKMGLFASSTKDAEKELERFNLRIEQSNAAIDRNIDKIERQTRLNIELAKQRGASEQELNRLAVAGIQEQQYKYEDLAQQRNKDLQDFTKRISKFSEFTASQTLGLGLDEFKQIKQEGIPTLERVTEILDNLKVFKFSEKFEGFSGQDQTRVENFINILTSLQEAYEDVERTASDAQITAAQGGTQQAEEARRRAKEASEERKRQIEQERKALLDLFVFRKGLIVEQSQLESSADSDLPVAIKVAAAQKGFLAQKAIIEAQRDFELSAQNLTATQRVLIQERAANDLVKLERDTQDQIIQIRADAAKKARDIVAETNAERLKIQTDAEVAALESANSNAEIARTESLSNLRRQLGAGLITQEEYAAKRERVEFEYQANILRSQIDFYEKQVARLKANGEDTLAIEAALAKARSDLSDLEVNTEQKKFDAIRNLEQEALESRKQALEQLSASVQDAFSNVLAGIYEAQRNRIQEQIDDIERLKAAEIDRINASGDGEEKKAARIKIIEAKAQAEREALERRQRQIDRQRAIAERAFKAFQITTDGIQSVAAIKVAGATIFAKALAATLNPGVAALLQTLVLSQIPFSIATTAANLVGLLASPLPRFAKGKKASDPYTGLGIWGEAGQEMKIDRSGNVSLSGHGPSLTTLMPGDTILPAQVTRDILNAAHMEHLAAFKMTMGTPVKEDSLNKHLIESFTNRVVKAINEKPMIVQNNIHNDAAWHAYIEQQVKR